MTDKKLNKKLIVERDQALLEKDAAQKELATCCEDRDASVLRVAQLEGFKVVLDGICDITTEFPNTNENVTAGVKRIKAQRDEARAALQKVQADAAAMCKALEFYADFKRWIQCEANGKVCDEIDDGDPMMVFKDGEDHPWSVAKEAIAAIRAVKGEKL